jgi:single-stranded-DNA-specific exonuclease
VPEFRRRFSEGVAKRIDETNSVPRLRIDGCIEASEIGLDLAEELDRLGPFGYGNPRPVFVLHDAPIAGRPRIVGRGHLKTSLERPGDSPLDCIGFDLGERIDEIRDPAGVEIAGHVSVNEWNGRRIPQFQLLDFREAAR